ncbi:HEAT repeat domain-containing protein [Halomonas sp. BM-2019]|uniref:HEAT repeat domain-containing protein n=1 Tax=Halomonas sp. BM-2019 TaxID=2811227 RepID=UPI001B3C3FE2|nr:MAG: HEAT repeat domain-containing protein [Halomonas sp. BM-2019]
MILKSEHDAAALPDTPGIWQRLREILSAIPSDFQARVEADLQQLSKAGVCQYQDLLKLQLEDSIPVTTRCTGLWALSRLNDDRGVASMLVALHDPAAAVRAAAAHALGDLGGQIAMSSLPDLESLLQDSAEEVRRAAVYALGTLGAEPEVATLARVVADPNETNHVRGAAVEALADLREDAARPVLRRSLVDPSAEVRYWAAFALGEIGSTEELTALAALADGDSGQAENGRMVSAEAAEAIARIESRATVHIIAIVLSEGLRPIWPAGMGNCLVPTTSSLTMRSECMAQSRLDCDEGVLAIVSGYSYEGRLYHASLITVFDPSLTELLVEALTRGGNLE